MAQNGISACEYRSFIYWKGILAHQKNILLLVRSLREANFMLFIATLENLIPLFFSLDHTHYSRWLPVFVQELKMMSKENPELFQEFMDGHFAVQKSKGRFCKMAYDQCHEQNNKIIKSKSGYVDLLNKEDQNFLRNLEIVYPEIYEYLDSFENDQGDVGALHKETALIFIRKYISDCRIVYKKFVTNPFLVFQFQKINTSYVFPDDIVNDAKTLFTAGESQYKKYVYTRFVLGSEDVIKTKISRNSFKLPSCASKIQAKSPQIKLLPSTVIKLRSACDVRELKAKEIFKT